MLLRCRRLLLLSCAVAGGFLYWPFSGLAQESGPPESITPLLRLAQKPSETPWDLQGHLGRSFSIKSVYQPTDPRGAIKLLDDGVQRDAVDLSFKTPLPGGLNGEGQFASTSPNSQTEKWFRQYRNQLSRVRMSGATGSLEYGGEYRSVGQGFRRGPGTNWRLDQEGAESWVAQKFGPFKVKGTFSEFHDNVEQDPHRPRNSRMLGGGTLSLALPGGATVGVSYQRGTLQTTGGPARLVEESTVDSYGASFYVWRPSWEAMVLSEYSLASNVVDSSRQSTMLYHEASATIRPSDHFMIVPSISLVQEDRKWAGTQTVTPMGMVSLIYTDPSHRYSLSSTAFYSRTTTSDGSYDVRTTNLLNSLEIPLSPNTSISFDVLFFQYKDAASSLYSYQETLGRVMYRVKAF